MAQSIEQRQSAPARRNRCPLSLHRTGQWYKKIHGKFYYFGTDKDAAIRAYEEQSTYLHTGQGHAPADRNNLTLLTLCNLYPAHQESRLNGGEIGHQHFYDQQAEEAVNQVTPELNTERLRSLSQNRMRKSRGISCTS